MTDKIGFLQAASGANSSKRLAFLSGHAGITIGLFWISEKLITAGKPELIVAIFNSYLIYCTILGGFVTADLAIRILEIIKNAKSQNNIIPDSNSSNNFSEFSEKKE